VRGKVFLSEAVSLAEIFHHLGRTQALKQVAGKGYQQVLHASVGIDHFARCVGET
jgi:hypothetical protein